MTRQRKRLLTPVLSQPMRCFDYPEVSHCAHCQYVFHEIIAHEQHWLRIVRSVFNHQPIAADVIQEFYAKKLPGKMHRLEIGNPKFKLIHYIARMVRNFSIDELYRMNRHSLIDPHCHISGITRTIEDQASPNVLREIEARDQLSMIHKILSESEYSLLSRILTSSWSVAEEAINEGISHTAVRARVKRMRAKVDKAFNTPPYSA